MAGLADQLPDERSARMALSMIAEPGDTTTGRVLARVGALETVRFLEARGTIPFLPQVDAMIWREHHAPRLTGDIPQALEQARQSGYGVLIPSDPDWPAGVNDLGDSTPYVLWTLGNETLLNRPLPRMITVTGSRAATSYGEHMAGQFAGTFAADGRVVVAGGAFGIESAAHRGALAGDGETVAVLAGGLGRPYPAGNRELLDQIADTGLLISELPPDAAPTREKFMARHRLEAALSGATVLVEAGARTSSLATANQARGLGRVVGAVPGPVTSAASIGPHHLIATQQAILASDPRHITNALDTPPATRSSANPFRAQDRTPPTLNWTTRSL